MPGRYIWKSAVIGTMLFGNVFIAVTPGTVTADSSPAIRARVPRCEAGTGTAQPDQVLEWNQIFIDTLIATNTANSSSQRLGAIVHTARAR